VKRGFVCLCILIFIFCGFAQDKKDVFVCLAKVLLRLKEKVAPSIVAIEVQRTKDPEGGGERFLRVHTEYFRRPKGPCTGTIFSKDGYILTSYFNISGELKSIKVTLHNGKNYKAKLVGYHREYDIALLKINANNLPSLKPAKLRYVKQGTLVAVFGRSPSASKLTLNYGIISAINRKNGIAVQTDAEINYGNSGGPLVDMKGRLIGIVSFVKPRAPWGQSGGVGFATKITKISQIIDRLKKGEKIKKEKRPWLGIEVALGAEDPEVEGVHVAIVHPNSPAQKAGIKRGDVIIKFDKKRVKTFEELKKQVLAKKIGDEVEVVVKRKEGRKWVKKTFKLKLEERP
jgi:serine protease Do